MNNALSVVALPSEKEREVGTLLFPKVSLDDLEKAVWGGEPELPKPAAELPLPKARATEDSTGLAAIEGENPENPDDPKPEAAGVLNENEAADVISGFLRPKVGVAAGMAELAAGTAPNAGVFPNTGGLPEGAAANPELGLKLKFWALLLLLLFTGKPTKTRKRKKKLLVKKCSYITTLPPSFFVLISAMFRWWETYWMEEKWKWEVRTNSLNSVGLSFCYTELICTLIYIKKVALEKSQGLESEPSLQLVLFLSLELSLEDKTMLLCIGTSPHRYCYHSCVVLWNSRKTIPKIYI